MATAKALEAKHEKILRALSRQPENKRCINCETLGPGYVVMDLRIFVCTSCAGIHRNYGHRVKSISMATFTPQEITNMQNGGNLLAEATYLARWNPSSHAKPTDRSDASLKKWIASVFQEKRYYTEHPEITQDPARASDLHASDSGQHIAGLAEEKAEPAASRMAQLSLISIDDDPAPPARTEPVAADAGDDWASFGNDNSDFAATAASNHSQLDSSHDASLDVGQYNFDAPPTAAPAPPPAEQGWAAFGDAAPVGAPATAPASSAPASGGGGWASFDSQPPSHPGTALQPPAVTSPVNSGRKELPSDLFADLGLSAPAFYGQGPYGGAPPGGSSAPMPPGYGYGANPGYRAAGPPGGYGFGGAALAPPRQMGGQMPPAGGNPFDTAFGGPQAAPGLGMTLQPAAAAPPPGAGQNPFALIQEETSSAPSTNQDLFTDLMSGVGGAKAAGAASLPPAAHFGLSAAPLSSSMGWGGSPASSAPPPWSPSAASGGMQPPAASWGAAPQPSQPLQQPFFAPGAGTTAAPAGYGGFALGQFTASPSSSAPSPPQYGMPPSTQPPFQQPLGADWTAGWQGMGATPVQDHAGNGNPFA
eukprot:jgi/Tetstr1/460885/TSEL_006042.t1